MAVDGSPEAPIAAVRVAPAVENQPPAAGPGPAAVVVEPAAAAAPVIEPAAPAAPAPEPKIELVTERPSLLETLGKEPAKAEPAKAEPAKPDAKADAKAKPESDKPAAEGDKEKPAADKPAVEPVKEAAKPEGEPKAADAKPEPLPPIEYAYKLPETLKVDDALKSEIHTAFDETFATNLQNETLRNQHKTFNDTRTGWNKDWAADEEIGGAGYQTSLKAIARMRDQFVSSEAPGTPKYQADLKSFENFLRITGAGDHPAFGRFLHNIARVMDEPAPPPPNIKPPPYHGQKPGSNKEKLYGQPPKAS
jgi:hypothetical protein